MRMPRARGEWRVRRIRRTRQIEDAARAWGMALPPNSAEAAKRGCRARVGNGKTGLWSGISRPRMPRACGERVPAQYICTVQTEDAVGVGSFI